MFRSSPPEVFSKKDAVQIRSKPTGEQPRRSATSTKPLCNFIEITLCRSIISSNNSNSISQKSNPVHINCLVNKDCRLQGKCVILRLI